MDHGPAQQVIPLHVAGGLRLPGAVLQVSLQTAGPPAVNRVEEPGAHFNACFPSMLPGDDGHVVVHVVVVGFHQKQSAVSGELKFTGAEPAGQDPTARAQGAFIAIRNPEVLAGCR